MATEVKLPQLGENLPGGDVLDVKVSVGDSVSQGQALLEVEAEKSTVEVPSPVAGKVTEMRVKKGDAIEVGSILCVIDGEKSEPSTAAPVREAKEPKAEKRKDETAAKANGQRQETKAAPAPPGTDGRKETHPVPAARGDAEKQVVPAGPATRRLARELGLDLTQVTGSAPGGRVTQDDVKEYVRALASQATTPTGPTVAVPALPDFSRWGPVEKKPLDGVRRKTAEHMALAWSQVAHVTQHDQADVSDLDAFRKQQDGKGPKLTVTAFALKAAAIALKQFPQFNSSLDLPAGHLVFKQYYHIGVAVDTDRGLLVPVIRDADKKSVNQLAQELIEIAERARQKKISADDMRGGTFTITNLGGIGGTAFTPIVNYPEVAILGLSRSRLQPVIQNGQCVPRLTLPLSLSYDHRVIDGADAARFTRRVAEMLESPLVMLLYA
jgi:pyruvate dehydrogenase E2 component (dihydrolipoamide acetyltransferase)